MGFDAEEIKRTI